MTDRHSPSEPAASHLPDTDLDTAPVDALPRGALRTAALAAGSVALLLAMATDALAVAGRHLGFTFLGAIEIVEACVVIAATSAIVIATLDGTHARVRILLEQIGPRAADRLERGASIVGAVMLVVVAVGSTWLASDLWNGQEITEVLGIPLRWLRLFWIGGAALTAAIFLIQAVRRPS